MRGMQPCRALCIAFVSGARELLTIHSGKVKCNFIGVGRVICLMITFFAMPQNTKEQLMHVKFWRLNIGRLEGVIVYS